MKSGDPSSSRLAADVRQTESLRLKIKQSPREGLKQVAKEFESLFINMMLKSMRDTLPQDGLFNTDQTRLYTSLLDQQLAQKLSSSGQLGFAKLIEQQLGRYLPPEEGAAGEGGGKLSGAPAGGLPQTLEAPLQGAAYSSETLRQAMQLVRERAARRQAAEGSAINAVDTDDFAVSPDMDAVAAPQGAPANHREFVNRLWPHAVDASRATGIPAQFLVAHAALETGWGKSEIRRSDGSSSYNLFGIKAGRSWQGPVVEASTTEYVGGVAQSSRERFRAYSSYGQAFRDYAELLQRPRFAGALGQQDGMEFARSLQQAGYATDPMYAEKLGRIINGPTLRQALQG